MGPVWRWQNLDSRRGRHLLRYPQRQRVEPARKLHAVRHSQRLWQHSISHKSVRWPRLQLPQHRFRRRHLPVRLFAVPPAILRSQSIEAINPNVKYSSVYQFNVSVQRQLPVQHQPDGSYVGTLGRHLQTFVDANYAPYATVNALGATIPDHSPPRRQHRRNVVNTMPAMALPLAP